MKKNTNSRLIKGALAVSAIAALVVVGRFGGDIAKVLPPEVLISLAAIAGLLGHAILELRKGAPRGFPGGFSSRMKGDLIRVR